MITRLYGAVVCIGVLVAAANPIIVTGDTWITTVTKVVTAVTSPVIYVNLF